LAIIKSLAASKTLTNQLKYLQQEGKTRNYLKDGINCNIENIEREFNTIKLLYGKTEGKQYYHFTQAFSPEDNITPEKANELGKELIQNNIKDYQFYIVTHIDKNHIHNHFVINSVNMENGRKLQISPKKLFDMKIDSNKICEREGFKKIDVTKKADIRKTMAELGMEQRGITTWKDELRQCIDFAKERTTNLEELKENLESNFKIITRETKNSISFRHPEQGKAVRGKKLGNKYTKEEINNEFIIEQNRGIKGERERRTDRRSGDTKNVDWSAISSNIESGRNRVPEQFSDGITGEIQQEVRGVKERTYRAIGISKRNDKTIKDEQRNVARVNKPRVGEIQSETKQSIRPVKPNIHAKDWELER